MINAMKSRANSVKTDQIEAQKCAFALLKVTSSNKGGTLEYKRGVQLLRLRVALLDEQIRAPVRRLIDAMESDFQSGPQWRWRRYLVAPLPLLGVPVADVETARKKARLSPEEIVEVTSRCAAARTLTEQSLAMPASKRMRRASTAPGAGSRAGHRCRSLADLWGGNPSNATGNGEVSALDMQTGADASSLLPPRNADVCASTVALVATLESAAGRVAATPSQPVPVWIQPFVFVDVPGVCLPKTTCP